VLSVFRCWWRGDVIEYVTFYRLKHAGWCAFASDRSHDQPNRAAKPATSNKPGRAASQQASKQPTCHHASSLPPASQSKPIQARHSVHANTGHHSPTARKNASSKVSTMSSPAITSLVVGGALATSADTSLTCMHLERGHQASTYDLVAHSE
jgi:hypothetical protein